MHLDDHDLYNSPTEPQEPIKLFSPPHLSGQTTPPTPTAARLTPSAPKPKMSRRAMMGASVAGLAGLGIGGVALEQWIQHGGLNTMLHGSTAHSAQIGHLLRRAGFGASAT